MNFFHFICFINVICQTKSTIFLSSRNIQFDFQKNQPETRHLDTEEASIDRHGEEAPAADPSPVKMDVVDTLILVGFILLLFLILLSTFLISLVRN